MSTITTLEEPTLTGLQYALVAYSFFRQRHQYKDRTKNKKKNATKYHNLARRIKDKSKSGSYRDNCRRFIRKARAAGFTGSFIKQTLEKNITV